MISRYSSHYLPLIHSLYMSTHRRLHKCAPLYSPDRPAFVPPLPSREHTILMCRSLPHALPLSVAQACFSSHAIRRIHQDAGVFMYRAPRVILQASAPPLPRNCPIPPHHCAARLHHMRAGRPLWLCSSSLLLPTSGWCACRWAWCAFGFSWP